MDFMHSERSREIQAQIAKFQRERVMPAEAEWRAADPSGHLPLDKLDVLKQEAKSLGLWNLFLPGLKDDEPGTGLSNLEYAPCAEIMGRIIWSPEVYNCSAPDTGNMEILHMFATEEQRAQWLNPLLEGEIRSCFSMTEPMVASSDATNLETRAVRDGDDYVITGRKWFSSGALDPRCKVLVVVCVTDPDAERHRRQSMILVPRDAEGVEIVRDMAVMNHQAQFGHPEIRYNEVRVPASNVLGNPGDGFLIGQARLGPGRIHHCMRCLGQTEVALEMLIERASERQTFGTSVVDYDVIRSWIAEARCQIDQARLLVLQTAWKMDEYGNKGARKDIAMIKMIVPKLQAEIANRAIQVFGAMGMTPDTPLADIWSMGRAMQIGDGPDEVHARTVSRLEIREKQADNETPIWPASNWMMGYTRPDPQMQN